MNGNQPVVPPPPPDIDSPSSLADVSVRTMESDVQSMMQGGGGAPQARIETVRFGRGESRSAGPILFKVLVWSTIALVGGLGLFFLGYKVLPLLFEGSIPALPLPTGRAELPTSTRQAPVFLGHTSFFRAPVDEVISIVEGYHSQLLTHLTEASPASFFFEVENKKTDGSALAISEFLFLIGAPVLDKDLLMKRFEPDFTMFVYREGKNFSPGYILKLKTGQVPLQVGSDILQIENATSLLSNLFLEDPGNASGTFHDAQLSGQPVRSVVFTHSGTTLHYGWFFNRYFIVSTSAGGVREALRRL